MNFFYIIFWRYILHITDAWTKNFSKLEKLLPEKIGSTQWGWSLFLPVQHYQTNQIYWTFKQIKYLDKERDNDDHNSIKYETCKERDYCKLYVFTTQHEMKNFKNN